MVANQRLVNPNGGATERRTVLTVSVLGTLLVLYQLNALWLVYIVARYALFGVVGFVMVVDCCCFRPRRHGRRRGKS